MRIIYFKRAGNENNHLHPEFIVEYISSEFLTKEQMDEWEGESMIEEHFQLELAKNEDRHQSRLKELEEISKQQAKVMEAEALQQKQQERQLNREFEEFKRWKLNKNK